MTALLAIVFLETLELLVAAVISFVAIGQATEASRGTFIALAILVLVLAGGIGFIGYGMLRGRKRLLGGVFTWQVMEIAVAIGAFQGLLGGPGSWWLGIVLLVPALAACVLCFVGPVTKAFVKPVEPPESPAARRR